MPLLNRAPAMYHPVSGVNPGGGVEHLLTICKPSMGTEAGLGKASSGSRSFGTVNAPPPKQIVRLLVVAEGA